MHNAARRSRAGLLQWQPDAARRRYGPIGRRTHDRTKQHRDPGSRAVLHPNERPASNAKRWAILIGFAAAVSIGSSASTTRATSRTSRQPPDRDGPAPAAPTRCSAGRPRRRRERGGIATRPELTRPTPAQGHDLARARMPGHALSKSATRRFMFSAACRDRAPRDRETDTSPDAPPDRCRSRTAMPSRAKRFGGVGQMSSAYHSSNAARLAGSATVARTMKKMGIEATAPASRAACPFPPRRWRSPSRRRGRTWRHGPRRGATVALARLHGFGGWPSTISVISPSSM